MRVLIVLLLVFGTGFATGLIARTASVEYRCPDPARIKVATVPVSQLTAADTAFLQACGYHVEGALATPERTAR